MIGVVGPSEDTSRLSAALEGVEVRAFEAEDVVAAGPDVVVAIGEPAACALVGAGVEAPVLPVEMGEGLDSVSLKAAPALLERGVEADFDTVERPVIEVAVDGEAVGRALFDAMLVTSEPARISEYAVETPGGVDRFRADGVVVATPAGSRGYARAVGGPVLDHDAACLAVVPVAAFAIRSVYRVTGDAATLVLRVEREESDVSLLVDGDARRRVPPTRPVTVRVAGSIATVLPPTAEPGRLEKL